MTVNLAFRGYVGASLRFEECVSIDESALDTVLPFLAGKHADQLAKEPHMIEIEFLDEPDRNQRFFRFGTDPSRMVMPMALRPDTIS